VLTGADGTTRAVKGWSLCDFAPHSINIFNFEQPQLTPEWSNCSVCSGADIVYIYSVVSLHKGLNSFNSLKYSRFCDGKFVDEIKILAVFAVSLIQY
jgi:hypothetical protein